MTVCADHKALLRLIKVIFIILMNTNTIVGIFVYSIMSSEFRKSFHGLICGFVNVKKNENDTTESKSLVRLREI